MLKLLTTKELLSQIHDLINKSNKLTILTAYLSSQAVDKFFVSKDCEIRLFTSLFNEFIEYEALEKFMALGAKIYIYTGVEFFHPKAFIFEGTESWMIMGSSNFTSGGLENNIELNLLLDEENVINQILEYVEDLRKKSYFKLLTEEALEKYKKLKIDKITHFKPFQPSQNDIIELYKQLDSEETPKSLNPKILKFRITEKQPSRDRYLVIWIPKKRNLVYGDDPKYFFPPHTEFEIQCVLSGHEIVSFSSYLTKSDAPQISGFYKNLERYGIEMHSGDILCFEELKKHGSSKN